MTKIDFTATKESAFSIFSMFILLIIISIFTGIWTAYVATILWTWFVTPAFGMVSPTLWLMYGLLLTVRYPFSFIMEKLPETEAKIKGTFGKSIESLLFSIFYPLGFLLVGWGIHFLVK